MLTVRDAAIILRSRWRTGINGGTSIVSRNANLLAHLGKKSYLESHRTHTLYPDRYQAALGFTMRINVISDITFLGSW